MAITSISGFELPAGGKSVVGLHFAFFDNSVRDVYVPWIGEVESTTMQRYTRWIAPFSGQVKSLTFMPQGVNFTSGDLTWVVQIYDGANLSTSYSQTQTATMTVWQYYELTYTNATFSKGQIIALFMDNNTGVASSNIGGTLLLEQT